MDLMFTIPRVICGLLLTAMFGADKFGMPWTASTQNLNLFEVAAWFPQDVAEYGGIFAIAPVFFAWMGAFSEAVGGLLLLLGLQTRIASFLIMCTMLVAIFMQKWNQGVWGMLPAMGFLWVTVYHLFLGSGRFGLDHLISKKIKS
ncbi:DoxX family protein [uncultured Psychroserpens sp.]|uniref:DoxX family protein n=1 Tax=uncultured Psychroserpens sp. TaxID=255436 RepID=UPI0026329317|nr:DoxX family protein [uncultured Psychroserpens sp.]